MPVNTDTLGSRPLVTPTKLLPPPARPEHISRTHLLGRIAVDALPTLAIVSAPAGYGKSTLLADLVRSSRHDAVGWLSLDRDDADPSRFWVGVTSALSTVRPSAFEPLIPLAMRGVDAEASLLPRLVEEAANLEAPVVLVLDDYHQLGRTRVHEQFSRLVELSPAQLRLVVGSRADPPLPLARLRAAGDLAEVRAADLRFTLVEATTFLNSKLALGLSNEELDVLTERSEGWVSALYLAALSVSSRTDRAGFIENFAGTNRFIVDYLAEEVVAQLPQEMLEFLFRCSALGRLSGPLLDEVLDRTGSGAVLRELERSNLFVIPLDDDRDWYRLHNLFADLLRAELQERDPALLPLLRSRASRWFAEHNLVDEAIEHALTAGDATAAGGLIVESFWPYLHRGQVDTVHRWLRELPEEHVIGDPRLCVIAAWASVTRGRPAEVESWLGRAETADSDEIGMSGGLGTVAAATSLVRAGLASTDVGQQVRAGRQAVAREYQNDMWSWIADGCLGIALFWAGEHTEARMRIGRVARPLAEADLPQAASLAHAYLALIELDSARDNGKARHQTDLAFSLVSTNRLDNEADTGVVHLARGKARMETGDLPGARDDLLTAVRLLSRGSNTLERAYAQIELAYAQELLGMRREAQAILEDVSASLADASDAGILVERLMRTRQRLGMLDPRVAPEDGSVGLTDRELEVLAYLPGPLSQREIGAALWVSFNTVTSHIRSIYRKLGVSSRQEAVERARELNIR